MKFVTLDLAESAYPRTRDHNGAYILKWKLSLNLQRPFREYDCHKSMVFGDIYLMKYMGKQYNWKYEPKLMLKLEKARKS